MHNRQIKLLPLAAEDVATRHVFDRVIHAQLNNMRYDLIQRRLGLVPSQELAYFQQEAELSSQIRLLDEILERFCNPTYTSIESGE